MLRTMVIGVLGLLLLAGCSAQRPVLYPNEQYKAVGQEKAQQDIDDCIKLAEESGAQGDAGAKLAARTGSSIVVGGATGAVVGAISGSAGRGSLIGAAAGGTASLVSGLFQANRPDPLVMRFVEQCLFERGYQVLGWR